MKGQFFKVIRASPGYSNQWMSKQRICSFIHTCQRFLWHDVSVTDGMAGIALIWLLGHHQTPTCMERTRNGFIIQQPTVVHVHTKSGNVNSREQHAGDTYTCIQMYIQRCPIHHGHNAFRNHAHCCYRERPVWSLSVAGADLPADKATVLKRAVVRQINSLKAVKSILDVVRLQHLERASCSQGVLQATEIQRGW